MQAALPFFLVANTGMTLLSGLSRRSSIDFERRQHEQNARLMQMQGEVEINELEAQAEQLRSSQIAAMAANGVDIDSPSALALQMADRKELEKQKRDTRFNAQVQANQSRYSAQALRVEKKAATVGALANAATSAVSGYATYKDIYG